MPIWFWLNIPAAALFVLLVAGIPMWIVLKRPDQARDHRPSPGEPALTYPHPVTVTQPPAPEAYGPAMAVRSIGEKVP